MRKLLSRLRAIPLFVILAGCGLQNTSENVTSADVTRRESFVPNEILLKVRKASDFEDLKAVVGSPAMTAVQKPFFQSRTGLWYKVAFNAEEYAQKISILRKQRSVMAMEKNFVITIDKSDYRVRNRAKPGLQKPPALPNPPVTDPDLNKAYGISKIQAPDAWKIYPGSKRALVADVDTGIDYNHEDLINNVWRNPNEIADNGKDDDNNGFVDDVVGWDFTADEALPFDDHSHGTHVAGTIGATGGNGRGVAGVSSYASIAGVKIFNASGSTTVEAIVKALDYTVKINANIISASWGGTMYSQAMFDAVQATEQAGILFVAAAGNSSTDLDIRKFYPAGFDLKNIVAVASTDSADAMSYFSNFGKKSVHLGAPGSDVYSCIPNSKYGTMSGTSMATPHVSGAAALIRSAYPKLKYADVKEILMKSVDEIPSLKDKTITGGRLNARKAMELAKEMYGAPQRRR